VIFPLTFIANTFVPPDNFPAVLKAIAYWNPVSAIAQAARNQFGNVGLRVPDVWPLQHPVTYTLVWVVVLLVIFVPLAVRTYLRSALR